MPDTDATEPCAWCGEAGSEHCPDCQAALCPTHRCATCGRCADDCLCAGYRWVPDLF
ncbi:MAG: hypothetical protein OWV35_03420 [Firmicutes bacterium]|nr:hypothetical protein [Bacillota bacterium]